MQIAASITRPLAKSLTQHSESAKAVSARWVGKFKGKTPVSTTSLPSMSGMYKSAQSANRGVPESTQQDLPLPRQSF